VGRKLKRNRSDTAPEFYAAHKFARIAPRKVRVVMDLIRGLPVSEALDILKFSPRRGAVMIRKVLASAIANADHAIDSVEPDNDPKKISDLDVEDLYVHEGVIDTGPSFTRWRPRARGSAYPIIKRTSHISIKLRPRIGAGS